MDSSIELDLPNLEDEVVSVLKHRAEVHGRSLSAEIKATLSRDAEPDRAQALDRLALKRKQLASGVVSKFGAKKV